MWSWIPVWAWCLGISPLHLPPLIPSPLFVLKQRKVNCKSILSPLEPTSTIVQLPAGFPSSSSAQVVAVCTHITVLLSASRGFSSSHSQRLQFWHSVTLCDSKTQAWFFFFLQCDLQQHPAVSAGPGCSLWPCPDCYEQGRDGFSESTLRSMWSSCVLWLLDFTTDTFFYSDFFFLLFTAAIAVFINPSLTPNPLILQIRASRLFAPH